MQRWWQANTIVLYILNDPSQSSEEEGPSVFVQGLCGSLPVNSGWRECGSGKKLIIPVQTHKGRAMTRLSLCYVAKGLALPAFTTCTLRASGSQQRLVTIYSLLTNVGNQPCMHRSQQMKGNAELFPAPFLICIAGSCAGLWH